MNSPRKVVVNSTFEPLRRMQERAARARAESDAAYFLELMYWGEFITKLTTLELVAGMEHDRDKSRYGLEYRLVRADGLGEWVDVLDEVAQGPSSQHLCEAARGTQRAVTQSFSAGDGSWQRDAVDRLFDAVALLDPLEPPREGKLSLRTWFRQFAWIRNRVRGHGAPTPGRLAGLCPAIEGSLEILSSELPTFGRQWAYLRRSLSGKFRVTPLSAERDLFSAFATESNHSLKDGVYVHLGGPRRVDLAFTDSDLTDFKLPNGGYRDGGKFEILSYLTDEREVADGTAWSLPVEAHSTSETQSIGELELRGQTFTNSPQMLEHYVGRAQLEEELTRVITDARHPVITLQGRGGIGKTSLALKIVEQLCESGQFFAVVWFSARDIDLKLDGPKVVKPEVLSLGDISTDFVELMGKAADIKARAARHQFFLESLAGSDDQGPFLFIFDNFETIREQADLYGAISNTIRLPNKALITTRTRDFKADYPIEVHGLERPEFDLLVSEETDRLQISHLVTPAFVSDLYDKSDGHPYIAKVLLGEVARMGRVVELGKIVASKDRILEALFERTYASLSPAAQRVFLTLCGWRSVVPRIGIEAALLRSTKETVDFEQAARELIQSSLVEEILDDDGHGYLSVPLAAALFGKQKLVVSPLKTAIDADLEIVRSFGAMTTTEAARGLGPRVARLARSLLSGGVGREKVDRGLEVLAHIAEEFSPAWLTIAELHEESGNFTDATRAMEMYLQRNPLDGDAWMKLAAFHRRSGDVLAELHARLQQAETADATVDQISNSAARLVAVLQKREIDLDNDERRVMVSSLRRILESRASEATAVDLSRLAWLCFHLQDIEGARRWTEEGLVRDPSNQHLLNLRDRLSTTANRDASRSLD